MHVAIIGISSQIGTPLIHALVKAGYRVSGISRHASTHAPCDMHVYDSEGHKFTPPIAEAKTVISLAPLPNISEALNIAAELGATRIVAFGSTGVFSKASSTSEIERQFVQDQLNAERLLASSALERKISWTLFRPTMIYGLDTDQNVTFIRNVIRRLGFFPIPIGANGLRQPVHVNDLAAACVAAIHTTATLNRAYNLGGGEMVNYGEMVRRIGQTDGRSVRLLPIPHFLYRLLVRLIKFAPGLEYIREEMVNRMFVDLIADNADAHSDFSFQPRAFEPGGKS